MIKCQEYNEGQLGRTKNYHTSNPPQIRIKRKMPKKEKKEILIIMEFQKRNRAEFKVNGRKLGEWPIERQFILIAIAVLAEIVTTIKWKSTEKNDEMK